VTLSILAIGFVVYLYIQGFKEQKRQKKHIENHKKANTTRRNDRKKSFLMKYSGKKKYQKTPTK
jgi:hypothetical protein